LIEIAIFVTPLVGWLLTVFKISASFTWGVN